MRTLLAALAVALAIPATSTPAAACGGDDIVSFDEAMRAVRHTASGQISQVRRDERGTLVLFVSYPDIDGEFSGLYGINVELRDTRLARRLERDHFEWSRMSYGWSPVDIVVERTGEAGAWRLVSYRRRAAE